MCVPHELTPQFSGVLFIFFPDIPLILKLMEFFPQLLNFIEFFYFKPTLLFSSVTSDCFLISTHLFLYFMNCHCLFELFKPQHVSLVSLSETL